MKLYGAAKDGATYIESGGRVRTFDRKIEVYAEQRFVSFSKLPEGFRRVGTAEFATSDDVPNVFDTVFPVPQGFKYAGIVPESKGTRQVSKKQTVLVRELQTSLFGPVEFGELCV